MPPAENTLSFRPWVQPTKRTDRIKLANASCCRPYALAPILALRMKIRPAPLNQRTSRQGLPARQLPSVRSSERSGGVNTRSEDCSGPLSVAMTTAMPEPGTIVPFVCSGVPYSAAGRGKPEMFEICAPCAELIAVSREKCVALQPSGTVTSQPAGSRYVAGPATGPPSFGAHPIHVPASATNAIADRRLMRPGAGMEPHRSCVLPGIGASPVHSSPPRTHDRPGEVPRPLIFLS